MEKASCTTIGRIARTHGLEGAVILKVENSEPEDFMETESVFVEIDNILVPFFVASYRVRNAETAIVKFDDVDSEAEAKDILRRDAYLPTSFFETDGDDVSIDQLIGLEAKTTDGISIGKIDGILDIPNNEQFEVNRNGKTILIPINDDWIVEFDDETILFDLPEGLLDLN